MADAPEAAAREVPSFAGMRVIEDPRLPLGEMLLVPPRRLYETDVELLRRSVRLTNVAASAIRALVGGTKEGE